MYRVYAEHLARLRLDHHTAAAPIERLDHRRHAIHVVLLLVHVLGEADAEALVELQRQRLRAPIRSQVPGRPEVLRVALVVRGETYQTSNFSTCSHVMLENHPETDQISPSN